MAGAGGRGAPSGAAIREMLAALDAAVERFEVVPDEVPAISQRLIDWADDDGLDLIVTTGGTGLGPRDVTPQSTRQVIDYEAPGVAEAMRLGGGEGEESVRLGLTDPECARRARAVHWLARVLRGTALHP